VDDCSTDGTADYLALLGDQIHVLRNEARGCFGHNMNEAAAVARSENLVLLNNDTEVTPFWLRRMLDTARADPTIGVIGNCQLYPGTSRINHAGVVFDEQCRPIHLYKDWPADFPPANVSRDFQALTGACLLVPRAVFRELGGFDPEFRNGYEDTDFCLRARQRGYRVRYVADSVIYHHIGSSPGRFDNEGTNEQYFAAKWTGRIVPDQQDYLARDVGLVQADFAVAQAQLTRLYERILGRAPDPVGVMYWAKALATGTSLSQVSTDIANSSEAQANLTRLYKRILGRAPDPAGQEYWAKALATGASLTQVSTDIANSPEAQANLTELYNQILGRAPDPAGQEYWAKALASGASLAQVGTEIANSPEAQATARHNLGCLAGEHRHRLEDPSSPVDG